MAFRNKADETVEDKIKKHQGLAGNELVQEVAFAMLDAKNQIEELNTDRLSINKKDRYQLENALFIPFRKHVRDLLSLTEADVKDQKLVKDIKDRLNLPYGKYPTSELTDLAQKLYIELRKNRIIWISLEHEEDSTITKLNRW